MTRDEIIEALRREVRTMEMSAAIMRDSRRTGGWEGAERTASAFERSAERLKEVHAALTAQPSEARDACDGASR